MARAVDDDVIRITWSGSVDAFLRDVEAAVEEEEAHDVVVVLAGVNVLDARALTALHRAGHALRLRGRRLVLVAVDPALVNLFHLTLLERSFLVARSPEDVPRLLR